MSIRSLITAGQLTTDEILQIFQDSKQFKKSDPLRSERSVPVFIYFAEESTRTRFSFERALQDLHWPYSIFDGAASSLKKGESLADTCETLARQGFQLGIIRHPEPDVFQRICIPGMGFINAGCGAFEHPTQALIDAFTLWERWGQLKGKTITIVGDIQHSRVARSNLSILTALGAHVILSGPPMWVSRIWEQMPGVTVQWDCSQAVESADAVMFLRNQMERHEGGTISVPEFKRLYGFNLLRLQRLPKKPYLMHPGPVGFGIELDEDTREYSQNLILDQVANGVPIRKAVLQWCLSDLRSHAV